MSYDVIVTGRCTEQLVLLESAFERVYHQYRNAASKTGKRRYRNTLRDIGVQLRLLGYLLDKHDEVQEFLRTTSKKSKEKIKA
jgi:hypothetical protein